MAHSTRLKERIVAERERWESEDWQKEVASVLRREGMAAELYDANGVLLFRSDAFPSPGPGGLPGTGNVRRRWVDHVEVFRGGRFVGHAQIAHPWLGLIDNRGTNWRSIVLMVAFVAGAAMLTAVFGIWLFSRIVLTPLSRLSDAPENIRQGRLDVILPRSRVREVQGLIDDFRRMVEGLQQSVRRQASVEEERRFLSPRLPTTCARLFSPCEADSRACGTAWPKRRSKCGII